MAEKNEKQFLIRVRADIRAAQKELKALAKDMRGVEKSTNDTAKSVNQASNNIKLLRNALGAYLSLQLAKNVIVQADSFNVLQSRIKTATRNTGDYNKVSEELFNISGRNGVQLETTVDLFQRLAGSAPELGRTNDEVLQLTNLVQQLGVIGGSSVGAMNAGLLQMSQGLSAGVFRAEEFNSVVENLPEVANAIAKGMGKTRGELRQMILDGKVLSQDIFEALLKQSGDINARFSEIAPSVQRTGVSLSNSFSRFLSQLDLAANGTGNIAKVMQFIIKSLDNWSREFAKTDLDKAMDERARLAHRISLLMTRGISDQAREVIRLRKEIDRLDQIIIKRKVNIINKSLPDQKILGDKSKAPERPVSTEEKTRQKQIEANIKALELEALAYGETESAIARYKLELKGATQAQIERANAALASIEADDEFAAAVEASEQAVRDENEAYQDWLTTLRDDGVKVYDETRTKQEQLAKELERFDLLLTAGAIDWDTYSRAVFDAQEQFEEMGTVGVTAMDELIAATKGWGDEFTNTLADAVIQGKADFKSLTDAIIRDLLRIAIYQAITKPALAALGVPGFAAGGKVSGPGTATSDSIPARLSAGEYVQPARAVNYYGTNFMEAVRRLELPRFAGGGSYTVRRPSVARFAEGGLVNGAEGGGSVQVNITNNGQPAQIKQASASVDVEGTVVNIVLADMDRNGPISGKLSEKFSVNRRA